MLLRLFYLLGRQKGNSWKNSQNANRDKMKSTNQWKYMQANHTNHSSVILGPSERRKDSGQCHRRKWQWRLPGEPPNAYFGLECRFHLSFSFSWLLYLANRYFMQGSVKMLSFILCLLCAKCFTYFFKNALLTPPLNKEECCFHPCFIDCTFKLREFKKFIVCQTGDK